MDCNSQLYINMGIRIGIKSETRYLYLYALFQQARENNKKDIDCGG